MTRLFYTLLKFVISAVLCTYILRTHTHTHTHACMYMYVRNNTDWFSFDIVEEEIYDIYQPETLLLENLRRCSNKSVGAFPLIKL